MKIKRVKLKNYRCFEEFDITFLDSYVDNGKEKNINLHVLLAPNMAGKSAVLKALRIAIGTRLQKIKANPAHPNSLNITAEEHRVIGINPFSDKARVVSIYVVATAERWTGKTWSQEEYKWLKYKEDYSGKHTKVQHSVGDIVKDSDNAFNRVIEHKEGILPLLLYVGTEYIHQQKAVTETLDQDGSAKQGYWYCLDDKSMEAYVFEWFTRLHATILEQQRSDLANELYQTIAETTLKTFKDAVKQVLPDILDVDWVKNTTKKSDKYFLVFNIKDQGIRTYEMLSDGYKYLVLLVGELVTRATLLNKHLGLNVLEKVNGVVLIDEFGIHLHPNLQEDALTRLSQLLPNVQFIVTTHSPLLVNGLVKEQIHIISEKDNGDKIDNQPDEDAIGLGAEGILREMFGVETTFDSKSLNMNEEYKHLLEKKNITKLNTEEGLRFRELSTKLANYRPDPTLKITTEDPISKIVKERLEMESQNTSNKTAFVAENLDIEGKVNSILDNILKSE